MKAAGKKGKLRQMRTGRACPGLVRMTAAFTPGRYDPKETRSVRAEPVHALLPACPAMAATPALTGAYSSGADTVALHSNIAIGNFEIVNERAGSKRKKLSILADVPHAIDPAWQAHPQPARHNTRPTRQEQPCGALFSYVPYFMNQVLM